MPKPKQQELNLEERLALMQSKGLLKGAQNKTVTEDTMLSLPERIAKILGIVQGKPKKSTTMNYMILYDITHNKVRKMISDYLIKNGCIRIQKSVFMANSENKQFTIIYETLRDINSYYENEDSIIMVPINVSDVRSMKLIGQNVSVNILTDPPNTLFF
jgi:CRISPR-associated endonuclease Cas2